VDKINKIYRWKELLPPSTFVVHMRKFYFSRNIVRTALGSLIAPPREAMQLSRLLVFRLAHKKIGAKSFWCTEKRLALNGGQ
jgi:hypothetical protein